MAEDEKRYYWLQLKKDFFKRNDIQIIEGMPNGKDYILFYLKLLCESVDGRGNLRFNNEIPYNENMLSLVTHTNVDVVRSAVKVFTELKMMDILDDGTYYMREVEKMIGSVKQDEHTRESTRKRVEKHRKLQKQKQLEEANNRYSNVTDCYSNVTGNGELKIDIDIDKERRVKNNNCADAQKTNSDPENFDFWKFAKENAEMAYAFHQETGLTPVKSQFGRWVNDLRDLAEAGISIEQMRKTIAYMHTQDLPITAPGSLLKTAQWLKARGSVPAPRKKQDSQTQQDRWDVAAERLNAMMSTYTMDFLPQAHESEVIDV